MQVGFGCDHSGSGSRRALIDTPMAAGHQAVDSGTGNVRPDPHPHLRQNGQVYTLLLIRFAWAWAWAPRPSAIGCREIMRGGHERGNKG